MENTTVTGRNSLGNFADGVANKFEFRGNTVVDHIRDIGVEDVSNGMVRPGVNMSGCMEGGAAFDWDTNYITATSAAAASAGYHNPVPVHENPGGASPTIPNHHNPTLPPVLNPRDTAAYRAILDFEDNFTNSSLPVEGSSEYGPLEDWVRKLEQHERLAYLVEQPAVGSGNYRAEPPSKRRKTKKH